MVFDKDFFDKIASDALKHYDWDRETYSKLIVLSENATYMVKYKDNDENAGVLRVSRPGYHTLSELESEMSWLGQINNYTPLIVAYPIKGSDGKPIQQIKGADGNIYFCVICDFLAGEEPDESNPAKIVKDSFMITPYFGFETVPAMVEEGDFPIKNQKKAILGSVLTCGAIYALFCVLLMSFGVYNRY